jgi:hypothetical protein
MKRVAIVGVALALLGPVTYGQNQGDGAPFREGRSICVPYNPATIGVFATERGVWRMQRADGAIFRIFANKEDADAGLEVARQNNQLCYIGKDNTAANRTDFIMEYWRRK